MKTKIKFNRILRTNGSSLWSGEQRNVHCRTIELIKHSDDFGELRVFFLKKTWNPVKHGLIYTDDLFERQLRDALGKRGYDSSDVSYSEQGMQGNNYVSFDVDEDFISSWENKHGKMIGDWECY